MTQTDALPWPQALQIKLMAALDALWAMLEATDDPAEIRRARDKARAIGDLASMAGKVARLTSADRKPSPETQAKIERLARVMAPGLAAQALTATLDPAHGAPSAQAEHARRALEKLKSRTRGRL